MPERSLPSLFVCFPPVVAYTTAPANPPFPFNHILTSPLPDVAFTCRRQLHSLNNYSPPRYLHLFCRDAALCTVSCLRLPQPVCTSPLPLLTQHLLRDCPPATRPRKLSAYSLHLILLSPFASPDPKSVGDTLATASSSSRRAVDTSRRCAILLTPHHTSCHSKPHTWLPTSE